MSQLDARPFAKDDADLLLSFFRDDHVRRYLLDGALVDRAWVEAEIAASAALFDEGKLGLFHVYQEGSHAGVVGFRHFHDPPVLELLYALRPAFTGRGLATRMARHVIELARAKGMAPIVTAVDAPNVASLRVLERLGFRRTHKSAGDFGPMIHFVLD